MKVKVLSRNPDRYFRETKNDLHKLPRNYDPALHPFEMQREYVRAVNAVKLERVFAKPFLGSFDGHGDVVSCLHKHPDQLTWIYSGAADGIVRKQLISLLLHRHENKSLNSRSSNGTCHCGSACGRSRPMRAMSEV